MMNISILRPLRKAVDVLERVVKVGKRMLVLSSSRNVCDRGFRKMRENGATLVEFAGMAIVVAIFIGGVIAAAPSHGREISCSILSKISEAVGGWRDSMWWD